MTLDRVVDKFGLNKMRKIPKVLKGEMKSRTDTPKNTIIPEREMHKFNDLVSTGKANQYKTREPVTYINFKHDKIGSKEVRVILLSISYIFSLFPSFSTF